MLCVSLPDGYGGWVKHYFNGDTDSDVSELLTNFYFAYGVEKLGAHCVGDCEDWEDVISVNDGMYLIQGPAECTEVSLEEAFNAIYTISNNSDLLNTPEYFIEGLVTTGTVPPNTTKAKVVIDKYSECVDFGFSAAINKCLAQHKVIDSEFFVLFEDVLKEYFIC